jgi:hypothetical protein
VEVTIPVIGHAKVARESQFSATHPVTGPLSLSPENCTFHHV